MTTKTLTDANFTAETATGLVLVDFYAQWCQPCKTMAPIVDELAAELAPAGTQVVKVDIEEAPKAARVAGIRSVPTFAVMKDGKIITTRAGRMTKQELLALTQVAG